MNKLRFYAGIIILVLAIPAIIHGEFSGYTMALLCIITGIKLICDCYEHQQ